MSKTLIFMLVLLAAFAAQPLQCIGDGCSSNDCHARLANGKFLHEPLDECQSCHSVPEGHPAGGAGPVLNAPVPDLCLTCHEDAVPENGSGFVVHGPVAQGRCTSCHDPHSSDHPWLLNAGFPAGRYAVWSDGTYDICFKCHRREMLMFPDTSYATRFRNGRHNLHYVHVRGTTRGRSCIICHDAHFTRGEALVRESFEFGNWNMPIKFRRFDRGGTCQPGCHSKKSYSYATTPMIQNMNAVPVMTPEVAN